MTPRMKGLAVLNVLAWLVAVPLLLVVLVDPFVDFGDWPDRVISGRGADVQLRGPEPGGAGSEGPAREQTRTPARPPRGADDPLRAAREAIARFRPATTGSAGALAPGGGVAGR